MLLIKKFAKKTPLRSITSIVLTLTGNGAGICLPNTTMVLFCIVTTSGLCCLIADTALRIEGKIKSTNSALTPLGILLLICTTGILYRHSVPFTEILPYLISSATGFIMLAAGMLHEKRRNDN